MYKKKLKMTIPQYRERKEVYEALGYKEVAYKEKSFYAYVTLENDESDPHNQELKRFERTIYRRGPIFTPIILLVVISFVLLSIFVILLAQQKGDFDLVSNAVSFLLPAFMCLLLDVIYTYFYFTIHKRLIDQGQPDKEHILNKINEIKNK